MHGHKALKSPFGRRICRTMTISALCVVLSACQSVATRNVVAQSSGSVELNNLSLDKLGKKDERLTLDQLQEEPSSNRSNNSVQLTAKRLAANSENCDIGIPNELSVKQGVYSTEALLKWEVARLHLQLDCMKATQSLVAVNAQPAPNSTTAIQSVPILTLADRWRPSTRSDDDDLDGVLDHLDHCPSTENFITVGKNGCGLFDETLHDVKFARASLFLSNKARAELDGVAEMLLAFPESGIHIRVHTDSTGSSDENLALTARRANVIAQYLLSRGVSQLQLKASGLGDLEPIASNATEEGRIENHRVDLVTLPDRDASQEQQTAKIAVAFANTNPTTDQGPAVQTTQSTPSVSIATVPKPSAIRVIERTPLAVLDQRASASKGQSFDGFSLAANRAAVRRNVTLATGRHDASTKTSVAAVTQATPAARAANPKQDDIKSTKRETVGSQVEPHFAKTSAAVMVLPVPGHAPGIELAGIVEDVTFLPRTAELSTQGLQALDEKRKVLMENPDVAIAVMAHTDDIGEDDFNKKLSMERAEAVVRFFELNGIDGKRLKPEGYGELLPLVQNMTEEDRKRNRRVEFRVLNEWPY